LWNLIRDCLDPLPEVTTIPPLRGDQEEIPKREIQIQTTPFISLLDLNLPPPEEPLGCPQKDDFDPDSDILSTEKEAKLEEEAVRYHDSPTIMLLLKNVSKAPKVVSFKTPHNGLSGK
jgi:hypothetical protein